MTTKEEKEVVKTTPSAVSDKASGEAEKIRAMSEAMGATTSDTRSYIQDYIPKLPEQVYSRGRGYVLYISNFYNMPDHNGKPRMGVHRDKQKISDFFDGFLYEVDFRPDVKTPTELWEIIDGVKKKVESKMNEYKSFFLIISSHGKGITLKDESGKNVLDDEDNPIVVAESIQLVKQNTFVRVDQIVSKFKHFMLDKPKVLMFQNCRSVNEAPTQLVCDSKNFCFSCIPQIADMVVIHDTGIGGNGWRDANGSWMFKCMFEELQQLYHYHHFLDVLTCVNDKVSGRQARDETGNFIGNQMPCFTSTLTKFFRLV